MFYLLITKVSSTNLSQRDGVGACAKGINLKLFHENFGYEGADGGPHSCTLDLFIILTLEEEVSVGEAEVSLFLFVSLTFLSDLMKRP